MPNSYEEIHWTLICFQLRSTWDPSTVEIFHAKSRGNRTHFLRITRGHQGLQSTNIFSACNFQLQVWALQIKIQLFFSQLKQLAPPSTGVLLMDTVY